MSVNIPQGPLIPSDSSATDGVFNGDVLVTGVLEATSIKAVYMTKATTVSTVTATSTLTAVQVLGGMIVLTTAASTLTLPTPALLLAAMRTAGMQPEVGNTVTFSVNAVGFAATLDATYNVTAATYVVASNTGSSFMIRFTDVGATGAYVVYQV